MRLTKEVAEQSAQKLAGGNSLALFICSSTTTSNGLTPTEKLFLHCRRRALPKVANGNISHRLLLLCPTRDLQISFRRDVVSGSTHPRLISEWLAEIDWATGIEDSGNQEFIFDKHQIKFETLDSKIATGIMKIIPDELKRRIN